MNLSERVLPSLASLSPKLQQAALYVVEHPEEIATRSLRQVARTNEMSAPTFSRLAPALGFRNYDALRRACLSHLKVQEESFAAKARALQSTSRHDDARGALHCSPGWGDDRQHQPTGQLGRFHAGRGGRHGAGTCSQSDSRWNDGVATDCGTRSLCRVHGFQLLAGVWKHDGHRCGNAERNRRGRRGAGDCHGSLRLPGHRCSPKLEACWSSRDRHHRQTFVTAVSMHRFRIPGVYRDATVLHVASGDTCSA